MDAWVCSCGLHKKINEWALSPLSFILLLFPFHLILKINIAKCAFEGSSIYPPTADGPSDDVTNDFLVPGCICAIAASEKSTGTAWFVKVLERFIVHMLIFSSYLIIFHYVSIFV